MCFWKDATKRACIGICFFLVIKYISHISMQHIQSWRDINIQSNCFATSNITITSSSDTKFAEQQFALCASWSDGPISSNPSVRRPICDYVRWLRFLGDWSTHCDRVLLYIYIKGVAFSDDAPPQTFRFCGMPLVAILLRMNRMMFMACELRWCSVFDIYEQRWTHTQQYRSMVRRIQSLTEIYTSLIWILCYREDVYSSVISVSTAVQYLDLNVHLNKSNYLIIQIYSLHIINIDVTTWFNTIITSSKKRSGKNHCTHRNYTYTTHLSPALNMDPYIPCLWCLTRFDFMSKTGKQH